MYDYIVVGAGSAGCVVASRLSEDRDARVLLLEAGPPDKKREIRIPAAWPRLFRTDVDWSYWSEPQDSMARRAIFLPRGKTLGGCSSTNAMMYVRGHPVDFDGWAERGCTGWDYDAVFEYFLRSEHNETGAPGWHGRRGPINVSDVAHQNPLTDAFIAAGEEVGIDRNEDFNGDKLDGIGRIQLTARNGRRCSVSAAYLEPARSRSNLTVTTGARVERVVFEGRRAIAVRYTHGGRTLTAAARREIVLCAGAYNSPQILMLSGVGPASHLRKHGIKVVADVPGVGQNLIEHVVCGLFLSCPKPVTLYDAGSLGNLLRYFVLREGILTSNNTEAAAFTRTRKELAGPDLEILLVNALMLEEGLTDPPEHGFTLAAVVLQPRSLGYVALRAASAEEPPLIQPNFLSDVEGADLETLVKGLQLARELAGTKALRPFVSGEIAPGREVREHDDLAYYARRYSHSISHPVGTCKMGIDSMAVVDPELRVRGVDGLRVIDASIMPTIVRGHPMAATIAIGEKGSDMLRFGVEQAEAPADSRRDEGAFDRGELISR